MEAVCSWALSEFGVVLDNASLWLSEAEASQAAELGLLFGQLYLKLAQNALQKLRPRYKMRPKFHDFMCGIVMRLVRGSRTNPRWLACFGEEDYIGKVCGMLKGSLHPATYGKRALERSLLGLNAHLLGLEALK